jgi:hypothetical protein
LYQIKKLLHSKRNNQHSEETAYRKRENLFFSFHPIRDQYPEYIKNSNKSNTKRINNTIDKWANKLDRNFSNG